MFCTSNLVSCERIARAKSNRKFTSIFDDRPSFRAKGLLRHKYNRNFTSILCFDPHFEGKRYSKTNKITNFPQFLLINPHSVSYSSTSKVAIFAHRPSFRGGTIKIAIFLRFQRSKGFSGTSTIAILPQFCTSTLISYERVNVSSLLAGTTLSLKKES